MPRNVKTKWTKAAERAAAAMWNDHVDTNRILLALKADHDLVLKAEDIHSLLRRKGGELEMIDGSDRQRAKRPARVANQKITVRKSIQPPKTRQAVSEGQVTPFEQLRRGQCRFALTSSLPHLFCRCDAIAGQSWCEKHSEIVISPRGQTR